jgi:hypothetical protein
MLKNYINVVKLQEINEFNNLSLGLRMLWLRQAETEDVATVMDRNPEFAKAVTDTVSNRGRISLTFAERVDYNEAMKRLLDIELLYDRLSDGVD